MISIRTKLTAWLIALMVLTTLFSALLFETMMRRAFHDSLINRLEEDLESVFMASRFHDGNIIIDEEELSSFYSPAYSGRYFQLNIPDEGILRSRSLWDHTLQVPNLEKGQVSVWQAKGPQDTDMQLLSVGVSSNVVGVSGTLTVAQDLSIGRPVFSEIFRTKMTVNAIMLVLMLLGIILILRQSFKSLRQVSDSIAKLKQGQITELSLKQLPPEFHPLAASHNELLTYTAQQLERSRNHIGNLSHGLKTPMAVLQQQIEVLGLQNPELATSMQQQLDYAHQLIEHKLIAARSGGELLPSAQMNLPKDLQALADTLAKVYHYKQIDCQFLIPETIDRLPIHREDGMEMIGNLLDNAFKFAQSQVQLSLAQTELGIELIIEDDGVGVAESELAALTVRGARLDESVIGHGLGLSIVKEICQLQDIQLSFEASKQMTGLAVRLLWLHKA